MAAPQVVNLAAKIIAVESYVAPDAIAELILDGATPRDGDEDFLLLHPKNTMALLQEQRKTNTVRRELKPDRARAVVR